MPLYDLKCTGCQHFIEDIKLTYEEMKAKCCPECGGTMESVPSSISVNTSESATFVRVPPERRAEISHMRETVKREMAEKREAAAKRRRDAPMPTIKGDNK